MIPCADFNPPCEFESMAGNVMVHMIEFDSPPGVAMNGVTLAGSWDHWNDGVGNCDALLTGECSTHCPVTCSQSPCAVVLGDPGAGYVVYMQVSGASNLRIGPVVEPPVVCL